MNKELDFLLNMQMFRLVTTRNFEKIQGSVRRLWAVDARQLREMLGFYSPDPYFEGLEELTIHQKINK